MGGTSPAARTENVIEQYVNKIPTNDGNPLSGQEAYEFYRKKNLFSDISLFNDPQF